ncbi:orotidine 5'-phosphate decarboxylase [Exiguobacterium sibiricum 255-15]|uniref:Orotidine 5'-phosphate decarboxylase n=1 Tax=Exiguobacterium sibiricum (strain DSM 17290 / CCUG 55495 / CIP 109462 / JCM 13490 / 255-15) TaxID=262543 RepID=B1YIR6_EXIS2|nr:orotidine-5'-phosphate decarboxylase [Exiguobacterium sibiricum]ACB61392.1 orotidine 5'-phosphate decarboxylase [Exiguobacterium sibiricum 255-15]
MEQLYIALDFQSADQVERFLEKLAPHRPALKVGMELYYAEGPAFVRHLVRQGHDVFLDLKVHDIPETARRTMRVIGQLGVELTNVHAAGGKAMMEAALAGLRETSPKTRLIAVTQLTSTDQDMLTDLMIPHAMDEVVAHYAREADQAGLDGVVCSALDTTHIKATCRSGFQLVTPGIRPNGTDANDQKRIATVTDARRNGATDLVIGRAITQAKDPKVVYEGLLSEWKGIKQ